MNPADNKDAARRHLSEDEAGLVIGQEGMLTIIRLCGVLHRPGFGIEAESLRPARPDIAGKRRQNFGGQSGGGHRRHQNRDPAAA